MASQTDITHLLTAAGIIASLPGTLPSSAVLTIGDALLAAPVTAVTIDEGADTTAIITDLRRRAADHMVVGGSVESAETAEAALSAGAQFITSSRLEQPILALCREAACLYLPGIISVVAAHAAAQAGCRLIRVATGGPQGAAYIAGMRQTLPDLEVVVAGDFGPVELGEYAAAGAAGVLVGRSLFTGPEQKMSDLISRARQLQQAWSGSPAGGINGSGGAPGS